MNYLKSFEVFESELHGTSDYDNNFDLNEAALNFPDAKNMPVELKNMLKKITPDEAKQAAIDIAKKLKLKVADLTNVDKVINAMAKAAMVSESEEEEDDDDVNEGVGDWLNKLKKYKQQAGKWLKNSGLLTFAGGVIGFAMNMPSGGTSRMSVEPNAFAVYGMAAIAIGAIAFIAGAKAEGTLGDIAKSAAGTTQQQ